MISLSSTLAIRTSSRIGNFSHCSFIFIFFVSLFLKKLLFFFFCTWSYWIWIIFKQMYLTHRWNLYGVSDYFSCCYYLTPFLVSLSFYSMLFCWFHFLDFLFPGKEWYEKKIGKEEMRTRYLLDFDFISGFQEPFSGWGNNSWIQMKWLCLPVKVLKCISHF